MFTVRLRDGGTLTGAPQTLVAILKLTGTVQDAPDLSGTGDGPEKRAVDYLRDLEVRDVLRIQDGP